MTERRDEGEIIYIEKRMMTAKTKMAEVYSNIVKRII